MEAGLNVTGWEQSPLNLWYPYMTDEMVWNTGAASCRPLVNTFCHELVLHKQPFWGAVDPCKVLKIFFHHFSLKPQVLLCLLKTDDVVLLRVKDSFEIQSSGPYRQITAMKEGRLEQLAHHTVHCNPIWPGLVSFLLHMSFQWPQKKKQSKLIKVTRFV